MRVSHEAAGFCCGIARKNLRPNQARHAQYPALDSRHRALGRREIRAKAANERTIPVHACEPGGDAERVVLIRRAIFERETLAPK
jgi:hypothetical protein